MEQQKQGRGGARRGAGRKKYAPENKKKTLGIRLSPKVYCYISANYGNKSVAIESLIKEALLSKGIDI